LDLLASQWAGIGLTIDVSARPAYVVDPEALILATAELADLDPRLADTSQDWIADYGWYVNHRRLDRMRRARGPQTAGTFDSSQGLRQPRGRDREMDFGSPAMMLLRLRGLVGVNARAELLLRLASTTSPQTVAALAHWSVYSKQNTAEAVGFLVDAGVAAAARIGNRDEIQLVPENAPAWFRPGGQLPPVTQWATVLPVLAEVARSTELGPTLGRVSAQVALRSMMRTAAERLAGTEWPVPDLRPGRDVGDALDRWHVSLTDRLAEVLRFQVR